MLVSLLKPLGLIFLIWNTPLASTSSTHKFYVSTTTIEYNQKANSLQISAQVFTDDLERALREQNQELRLDPDSNQVLVDQGITTYFKETLKFIEGKTELEYHFLGKEYVKDITKCYLELSFKKTPKKIALFNRLFFNLFEEQQNIVHFKNSTKRNSFMLHKKEPTVTLSLAL